MLRSKCWLVIILSYGFGIPIARQPPDEGPVIPVRGVALRAQYEPVK